MDTGVIAIVVAAVVAVAVAWWQIAASRDRPRPHFALKGEPTADGAQLPAVVSNAGGAAVRCHALAHVGRDFYEFQGSVAAQSSDREISMMRLGNASAPTESEAPFVLWTVAADSRDRWWDVRRGRRIRRSINKWLDARSRAAGLPIPVEML